MSEKIISVGAIVFFLLILAFGAVGTYGLIDMATTALSTFQDCEGK